MKYFALTILLLGLLLPAGLRAQRIVDQYGEELVQFSGMVLDGGTGQLTPVPYATVLVTNDGRGTYANLEGFFSIVARKNDTIRFSALGYRDVEFIIPDTLADNKYSIVQLMTRDAVNLPETVVFPWPSRDHFKLEFLAMDVTPELQQRASENLSADKLERLQGSVARSGAENSSYYLRQQARQTYYIGQRPPMNIFSPVAWKQFFDGWKRGDFKRKD